MSEFDYRGARKTILASALKPNPRLVLLVLIEYMPTAYPGKARLRDETGLSIASVKRSLQELECMEVLVVDRSKASTGRDSNVNALADGWDSKLPIRPPARGALREPRIRENPVSEGTPRGSVRAPHGVQSDTPPGVCVNPKAGIQAGEDLATPPATRREKWLRKLAARYGTTADEIERCGEFSARVDALATRRGITVYEAIGILEAQNSSTSFALKPPEPAPSKRARGLNQTSSPKRKPAKAKPEHPEHAAVKTHYESEFQRIRGYAATWGPAQGKATNDLIRKLKGDVIECCRRITIGLEGWEKATILSIAGDPDKCVTASAPKYSPRKLVERQLGDNPDMSVGNKFASKPKAAVVSIQQARVAR